MSFYISRRDFLTTITLLSAASCNKNAPPSPPLPVFEPETEAIWAVGGDFATDHYSDDTAKTAVNDAIVRLKDLGRWGRIVFLNMKVGSTELQHSINYINPANTDASFRLVQPNGATFTHEGTKYNGTNQYSKTFINANEEFPAYSFCGRVILKENSMPGAGDYVLFGTNGLSGSYLNLEYFNNSGAFSIVNVLPALQITSGLPALNGLVGINCYGFNKFDFWQGGAIRGSQTAERKGYFPSLDPSTSDARLYISANNNNTSVGVNTPVDFGNWTNMYNEFSYGILDSDWIDDDDYLINTFCPAVSKTFI